MDWFLDDNDPRHERVNQMSEYFDSFFSKFQSGFRKGYSAQENFWGASYKFIEGV